MTRERNFEVMRTLAMFCIVIYHCMTHGIGGDYGFDLQQPISLLNFFFSDFILVFGSIAVNLYVMVSGYFLVEGTFKASRIVRTWVSSLFYSVIITLVFFSFSLESWSIVTLGKSFFPLSTDSYWFVTQYIGLLILSPFLSILVKHLSYRQYIALLMGMGFMVLSVIPDFPLGKRYSISHGNSVWSFAYLFLIAGFIRFYVKRISTGKLLTTGLGLVLMTMALEVYFGTCNGFGRLYWFNYNGIILILSVVVFVFVRQLKTSEEGIWNIIVRGAPFTFGVYLIHDNLLVRDWLWNTLSLTTFSDQWMYPFVVLAVCLIIFVTCALLDAVRKKVFTLLKIDSQIAKLDIWQRISKLFT